MTKDQIIAFCLMGLVGSGLLVYGILIRMEKIKYWWAIPYYAAGQEVFVAIPGGLTLLAWAIGVLLPEVWNRLLLYIGIGFGMLALIFLIFKPRFLKPAWLQWLEDNHEKDIPLLRKEARRMGASQWAYYVRTQADLERWVSEVLRKHKIG